MWHGFVTHDSDDLARLGSGQGFRVDLAAVRDVITRANYMFHLVEVPAGASRVEFSYRPMSLALGGAISAVTVLLLAVPLWRSSSSARATRP